MKYLLPLLLLTAWLETSAQFNLNNSHLIAYYPLNGHFLDVSGKSNHATSNGNMTFTSDKWGYSNCAAVFDGIDDWLQLPLNDLTKKSFTVLWQFRYDTAIKQTMLYKGNPVDSTSEQFYVLHSHPSAPNRLTYKFAWGLSNCQQSYYPSSTSAAVTDSIPKNQWNCAGFSVQRDSNRLLLQVFHYLGTAVSWSPIVMKLDTCNNFPLVIGRRVSTFFKGAIDEIRVYDTALLQNLYANDTLASSYLFSPYCSAPPLNIYTFVDTMLCPGRTFNVNYTGGSLFSNNVISVQLSNAAGSFTSPVTIGSVTTTTIPGTISCTIPGNTIPGTGYRIRLKSSNMVDSSLDNAKNIRITAYPTINASSNSPVCVGSNINLSATGTSGVSYNWSGPNSFNSTQQNPTVSNASPSTAGNYIATATQYTCSSKDTVTVAVQALPATPVATSNSPVCPGSTLQLSTPTIAGASYSWTGPNSFTSTSQNPSISNFAPANIGMYSVTVTTNGCTSLPGTASVVPTTLPAGYSVSSNSPVCAGGVLNLNVSTVAGAVYSWTGPNGFVSSQQNPLIAPVNLNYAGTYSVNYTLNGCTYASSTTSVIVNNLASVNAYPTPSDTVCINAPNTMLVGVPVNVSTGLQYQWYKNNALIGGASSAAYPATGIADGDSFYCRMTVTGLCADPLVLYSNKVGMTVLPLTAGPNVSITADPGTLLSPWQLVKFTAVATNAGTLPKYQWKRNGQDVIGATSNVWSANNLSNGDTISCVVTSDVWCASPASEVSNRMVVNIKTGITDVNANGKLELYPNPNNGTFAIDIPLVPFQGGNLRVDVVDALGRTVYSEQQSQLINQQLEIQLPVSMANGVYVLKLSADGAVSHARFTVSR